MFHQGGPLSPGAVDLASFQVINPSGNLPPLDPNYMGAGPNNSTMFSLPKQQSSLP